MLRLLFLVMIFLEFAYASGDIFMLEGEYTRARYNTPLTETDADSGDEEEDRWKSLVLSIPATKDILDAYPPRIITDKYSSDDLKRYLVQKVNRFDMVMSARLSNIVNNSGICTFFSPCQMNIALAEHFKDVADQVSSNPRSESIMPWFILGLENFLKAIHERTKEESPV